MHTSVNTPTVQGSMKLACSQFPILACDASVETITEYHTSLRLLVGAVPKCSVNSFFYGFQ